MSPLWLGRPVHYQTLGTPGEEFPSRCVLALVTTVHHEEDTADLVVFYPHGLAFRTDLSQGTTGNTWHLDDSCDG